MRLCYLGRRTRLGVALGEFQGVTVAISDEGDEILAAGPVRSRFLCEYHSFGFQLFAELIKIGNENSDMAGPRGHLRILARSPDLDQLERMAIIVAAVADIGNAPPSFPRGTQG